MADTKTAQANIQAQRASLADTEQNVLLAAVDLLRRPGAEHRHRRCAHATTCACSIQQLDATRERFRVGELTITDVSQAEARLEGAKADLVQAEAQVRIAEAAFQRTIGRSRAGSAKFPLIGGLPVSEEEAISLAMDYGPRAVSAQYRISAASYGVNSAVGDLLPQVNLVGVIQQQFDLQVPTDQYYTYGVRLQATVPIYQNGSEWSRDPPGQGTGRPAAQRARQRPPRGGRERDPRLAPARFRRARASPRSRRRSAPTKSR